MPDLAAPTSARLERWLWWAALGALTLLGLVLGYRQISSPDLGFHMTSARWILEHGAFPRTEIFTYTVPDRPYIDQQWLFQLLMHGLHRLMGPVGITLFTTLSTLAFSALLLGRTWRRNRQMRSAGLLLILLFFLGNLWEPRPHLLSWVFGAALLWILEEYARGNRRWLKCLPLIMVLWVNSHSLFVLGLVILGTYLFSEGMIGLWKQQRLSMNKQLLGWSAAALAACLINPYHVEAIGSPLKQFFLIQGSAGYKSTTTGTAEFLSPFRFQEYFVDGHFVLFQPRLWWQLFTVLAVAGMLGAGKKARLAEWILFLGFLYLFHQANKNFGYFAMACFPAVASGLNHWRTRLGARWFGAGEKPEKRISPRLRLYSGYEGIIGVCLLLTVAAGSGYLYDLGWQGVRPGRGLDKEALPVEACQFINRHGIRGRILNCWDDGGYIGWATGQKVFIAGLGKVMGLDFYDSYIHAREPQGFPEALAKWKPTVALVRFEVTPYWLYYLHHQRPDWRMVYADDATALFLHETVSPQIPALPPPQPGRDYPQYDARTIQRILGKAVQAKPRNFLQWLEGKRAFPNRAIARSAFYMHIGELDACIATALAGLDETSFFVPDLMLTLGHAFNARRQYVQADQCHDAFLRVDRNPVIAQEIQHMRQRRRR